MKNTFFSLARASVIIFGSLALSLVFKTVHPILSILIVFSLVQIAEDTTRNIKEIAKLNKAYGGELRDTMVKYQKQRLVIDILTIIGWFILAAGAFYLSLRFLS